MLYLEHCFSKKKQWLFSVVDSWGTPFRSSYLGDLGLKKAQKWQLLKNISLCVCLAKKINIQPAIFLTSTGCTCVVKEVWGVKWSRAAAGIFLELYRLTFCYHSHLGKWQLFASCVDEEFGQRWAQSRCVCVLCVCAFSPFIWDLHCVPHPLCQRGKNNYPFQWTNKTISWCSYLNIQGQCAPGGISPPSFSPLALAVMILH